MVPRRTPVLVAALGLAATTVPAALGVRAPTASERTGVIAGVRSGNSVVGQAPRRCDAASVVRVSTVDRRYAIWTQDFRRSQVIGGCAVGNGFIITRLQPSGRWRIRLQGSGYAPCSVIGTRIAKDLLPGSDFPCG